MLARMFLKYFCLCCVLEKNGIESAIQRGMFTFEIAV